MLDDTAEKWLPPYEREKALSDLPKILGEQIDQVRHERDVLLVVNHALEKSGVKTMAEFADWISRNLWNMSKSGMAQKPHPMVPQEPQIAQLARYIRWVEQDDASRRA